jgi:hypothetical protein
MLLRAALLVFLSASAALAGPWPERTSGTFLSLTEDFSDGGTRGTTSIFVESGGNERFTIGLDSELGETDDDWSAYAFVRQPLSSESSRDRVAVSAGVGARQTSGGTEPLIVLGGAWGRDVENGFSGWLSLEGEARYGANSRETELQGGATIALEPLDRIALVNELSITGVPGSGDGTVTELTSSIVSTISDRTRIELGATLDLAGEEPTGIRFGTWLEF